MQRLIVFSIIIIFTLTSCQKCKNDKNAPKYTISGVMMQNCTMPYANKQVSLIQQMPTTGNSGGTLVTGTTDATGNFILEYTPENSGYINLRNYNDNVITEIPAEQTINFGTITINPVCKVIMKVKVYNNYASISDTFNCGTYGISNPFIMKTPLHDTVYPMLTTSTLLISEYSNYNKTSIDFRWWFGNKNYATNLHSIIMQINTCNTVPDTVLISIN